jgi:hypothetical protein
VSGFVLDTSRCYPSSEYWICCELFHGRGETDDATFVWLPEQRILVSGDFVIWVFPNAGNPRQSETIKVGANGSGAEGAGARRWHVRCDVATGAVVQHRRGRTVSLRHLMHRHYAEASAPRSRRLLDPGGDGMGDARIMG